MHVVLVIGWCLAGHQASFLFSQILSKLCAAIGQDAFDSLYRTSRDTPWNVFSVAGHLCITTTSVVLHSLLLFVQVVSLNVAINSHSNALLTLLVSNNFIELKGSVFKKFGPENLLQISCSGASFGRCVACAVLFVVFFVFCT